MADEDLVKRMQHLGMSPRSRNVRATLSTELLEIDGRTLEGGGQLLRLSLTLSALISRPVHISNIRGKRKPKPGLKAQHLACVQWLARACNTTVVGAEKGSTDLVFTPGKVNGNSPVYTKSITKAVWDSKVEIGTAGSTGLLLQAILPFILFSPPRSETGEAETVRLAVSGGTNVSGAPSYDYIANVLLPTLTSIGFPPVSASLEKRGWSSGRESIGSFTLLIPPRPPGALAAFKLCRQPNETSPQSPSMITAKLIAPPDLHQDFTDAVISFVAWRFGEKHTLFHRNLTIDCEASDSTAHLYLLITSTVTPPPSQPDVASYFLAADHLPERKIPPARQSKYVIDAVTRCVNELCALWTSGARADEHLRDQLVVFQALAEGRSEVFGGDGREISLHARTAEWVAKQMLGVRCQEDGIEGIGFGANCFDP
ncbi:hypothetical protein B0A48_07641 [Cryoendolithus antarcticus]|uniref:RNA 3'-terminal phosphate cyclase domain-containing protein n=1 Tax=Cryoendolithus antarcticus TaxID=1507870 RepID=A0A1V8T6N6_9PEZI|nr:hypothetical protein B0A48_07641 [Cryoendolithus antarcticus]